MSPPPASDTPVATAPPLTPKLRPVGRRSFATLRTIIALMLREMATTYGRSPGGYIWAVLEPVGGIALLTLVFSAGFKSPPMGTVFVIFYATGLIPFLMFLDVSGKLALSILFSRQLLAYPGVTYIDALIARFILNTLTHLMVAYIIFTGILLFFDTRTTLELDRIALGFAMTMALALGVGTMNCFLFSMFPVWQRVWSILTRPLFILSCIFFLYESVPDLVRDYLWYLPTVHLTGIMRSAFYVGYDASYVSPTYVFVVSGVLMVTGLVFLRRYHREVLNNA
ncbi:ABC transporter permease [Dinoroseobacter sp. S375]|uniref:ABC transporter permease n=1 Tax=Dinoroseobacter sp. S375 TaxID=3415136 RepID=UPI003C7C0525